MKKVIAAVGLTAVGMLLALLILPHFGMSFSVFDSFQLKTSNYTVGEDFDTIVIQNVVSDVDISVSSDDTCGVYIRDLGGVSRSAQVEDGVLNVTAGTGQSWLERLLPIREGERYISIYLPEGTVCAIDIRTTDGGIYVSDQLTLTGASIVTDQGDIFFHADVRGELTMETNSGRIFVSDAEAESLTAQVDSGDLSMDTVAVSGPVEITGDSGEIWLWDCEGESFRIETDSGDVSGDFPSPRNFVIRTDSGNANSPRTDKSAGLCQVTTVSGDIWLYVDDEDSE